MTTSVAGGEATATIGDEAAPGEGVTGTIAVTGEALAARDREQSARGVGTNFLTLAGQTSLLAFQMVGARLFGVAVWGAYAWGLSVIDVCGRLALAGSDKGILIFVPARKAVGDEAGAARAVSSGVRLGAVLSVTLAAVMAGVAGLVARGHGDPRYGLSLRTLSFSIPLIALTTLLMAATMALRNLRFNLLVKGVTEPVLRVALVTALGLTASGVGALTLVHVFAAAGTLAVAIWGFSRMFSLRRTLAGVLRGPLDRELLRYAAPLAAAEVVNSALGQLNVIVLGSFRPAEDVGAYAAAATLAAAVSFLRGAFDTVMAPIAAESWVKRDHARLASAVRLYSRTILTFAFVLGGAMLVGGPALLALHGPGFVRAGTTLVILVAGHMFNASFGIAGWVLLAGKKSRLILANNVGVFALNLVLCLVLVPRYGMEGAALAASLSVLVINFTVAIEVHFLAHAHPLSAGYVRVALVGGAVIAAELVACRALGGVGLAPAALIVVSGIPVIVGLAFLLGGSEDREMLLGLVRRRGQRAPDR